MKPNTLLATRTLSTFAGLLLAGTCLLATQPALAAGPQLDALVHFTGNLPEGGNGARPGANVSTPLRMPSRPLVAGPDGHLYAATAVGAGAGMADQVHAGGAGRLFFRYKPGEQAFERLVVESGSTNYYWLQALTMGSDGRLYSNGAGQGTVVNGTEMGGLYRYDAASSAWIALAPGAPVPYRPWIEAANGRFFSDNGSGLVSIQKDGNGHTAHALDTTEGSSPRLLLAHSNGRLYGVMAASSSAANMGAIISIDPDDPANSLRVLHRFTAETTTGRVISGMVEGADGMLYLATRDGGPNGTGALYRIDPAANQGDSLGYQRLYSFDAIDSNNVNAEGASPTSLLQGADGHLYGTAYRGGLGGQGVVFRWHAAEGYQMLSAFSAKTGESSNLARYGTNGTGMQPKTLVRSGDAMYGLAEYGGSFGWGTLFRFTPGDTLAPAAALSWQGGGNVALGYSQNLNWLVQSASNCQASTDDPTGSSWTGARASSGTQALTFSTLGTWTYRLTCDAASGSTPTVSASLTVQVVTTAPQTDTIGNGGGGTFTAALALLPLLGLARRRTRWRTSH